MPIELTSSAQRCSPCDFFARQGTLFRVFGIVCSLKLWRRVCSTYGWKVFGVCLSCVYSGWPAIGSAASDGCSFNCVHTSCRCMLFVNEFRHAAGITNAFLIRMCACLRSCLSCCLITAASPRAVLQLDARAAFSLGAIYPLAQPFTRWRPARSRGRGKSYGTSRAVSFQPVTPAPTSILVQEMATNLAAYDDDSHWHPTGRRHNVNTFDNAPQQERHDRHVLMTCVAAGRACAQYEKRNHCASMLPRTELDIDAPRWRMQHHPLMITYSMDQRANKVNAVSGHRITCLATTCAAVLDCIT